MVQTLQLTITLLPSIVVQTLNLIITLHPSTMVQTLQLTINLHPSTMVDTSVNHDLTPFYDGTDTSVNPHLTPFYSGTDTSVNHHLTPFYDGTDMWQRTKCFILHPQVQRLPCYEECRKIREYAWFKLLHKNYTPHCVWFDVCLLFVNNFKIVGNAPNETEERSSVRLQLSKGNNKFYTSELVTSSWVHTFLCIL